MSLSQTDDMLLHAICSAAPVLQTLNLSYLPLITDKGVDRAIANTPHLTHIDIFNCTQLTDKTLNSLARPGYPIGIYNVVTHTARRYVH